MKDLNSYGKERVSSKPTISVKYFLSLPLITGKEQAALVKALANSLAER